ncbi:post-GPI attachment to proteins factor 2-like isoform X1 [Tribolium madens]|uniref:post-GPI attachment to proteins factor 2-like isoform X1 n=2 Tax=Tribolium madens TaxID=41895 RepID=UPI001CF72B0D|nr:post-GPI attachment to proteins factor 2-like isoform X1 [Tribolium madens]
MPNEARYALLYSDYESAPILRLPFEKFSIITVGLPLFAFIFCIIYSVIFHFETATYTHCQVFNVLPSISAAIGNFSPQRQVWQMAIVLHAVPRFSIAFVYLQHHQNVLYQNDQWMGAVACVLNVVENISLIILSFWTSSQHYPVHEKAFITFILMSEFYMILIYILQRRCKKRHKESLKWKKRLLITNISSILVATYCFLRHNSYCEPYVYSGFALAEYTVVLTNMAFHMTAYLDFKNKDLVVYKYGVALTER